MVRAMSNNLRGALLACAALGASCAGAAAAPRINLCPGAHIVTAINESARDYESIKTITAMDNEGMTLRYSSEAIVYDWLNPGPGELKKVTTQRHVRAADIENASLYLQQFGEQLPEAVPETTAISISRDTFRKLKSAGEAEFAIFIPFGVDKPVIDRNEHPNVYDNQMIATVTRAKDAPALTVSVNGVAQALPTLRFTGDFYGDKAEFFVLDDVDMPLVLKFRIGIGANKPLSPDEIEQRKLLDMPTMVNPDKEILQVVKIQAPCPPRAAAEAKPEAVVDAVSASLEKTIADTGRVDIEAIYFTVNSATLRPESDAALAAIAAVMKRQPTWRMSVEGHTDSQSGEAFNLDLSKRRAGAVKDALAARFGVAAARLTTTGHGEAKPVADNTTLEGRARNRRVEFVRQ